MTTSTPKRVILFVCTGNVARSAIAERCAIKALAERGLIDSYRVFSRGIQGSAEVAPPNIRRLRYHETWDAVSGILSELGIDLEGHIATPIAKADAESADVIVAMDRGALSDRPGNLYSQFPDLRDRMHLFTTLRGVDVVADIRDPNYSTRPEEQRVIFEEIQRTIFSNLDTLLDWCK